MKIGVISDTHGMLSPNADDALQGVEYILHAGDIGGPDILKALNKVAPTVAVRGNMDGGAWAKTLPPSDMVELGGTLFYITHDVYTLDIDPLSAGIQVVVSGHTHLPEIKRHNGILFFNPGSASYGKYDQPPSVGCIELEDGIIQPRIIQLDI